MTEVQIRLEILKLIISLLTPLVVLIAGFVISKKIERNKLDVLKEKEWQVKWAEIFLKHATDFNDNISIEICLLFRLQREKEQVAIDEINRKLTTCKNNISEIDWNIRNFAQFSEHYGNDVIKIQQNLMSSINSLIEEKKGDLEKIREQQFEYNNAVRKAHNEILKMK